MKKARVVLMVLVAGVLATGTIFERYRGAEWVAKHFYGSWWFAVLMGLVAVGAIVSIVQGKMWRRPAALLIHAAVPVILLGGAFTTWTGKHYSITLAPGETKEGITLERFEVVYYPGTSTPMDFVSQVTVPAASSVGSVPAASVGVSVPADSIGGSVPAGSVAGSVPADSVGGKALRHETISMNHILRFNGRRYYQEDYDEDGRTTLSVSYDPWGIPVTYTGYSLLLLGLGWLCTRRFRQRECVRRFSRRKYASRFSRRVAPLLLLLLLPLSSFAAPRTLPSKTASKMGEMYVLYKGRICPLQTYAKDFTTKLTGKATYEGLSSEQVFGGFLFYYSEWETMLDEVSPKRKKESESLVQMLLSGHGLKLFPVATDSVGGQTLNWYAQNDDLPMTISDDEYIFVRKQQGYCQELVIKGDFDELERVFEKTRQWQEKQAADVLPSPTRVKAERLYNALTTGRWLAMLTLTLGLIFFAYSLYTTTHKRTSKFSIFNFQFSILYLIVLTSYLLLIFVLRWIAGGHVPMAGGFDSMNLMAMTIGILGLVFSIRSRKFSIFRNCFDFIQCISYAI